MNFYQIETIDGETFFMKSEHDCDVMYDTSAAYWVFYNQVTGEQIAYLNAHEIIAFFKVKEVAHEPTRSTPGAGQDAGTDDAGDSPND